MTYGLNMGYNLYDNYNYLNYQNNGLYNQAPLLPNTALTGSIYQNNSAGTVATQQQTQATKTDNVADGKDDGKIGFWKATGNFLKGAIKFVTSPFTDEQGNFSLGKTLKSVAIGAAIALIPGGTAIALAAGVTLGGIGMVRAGVNIATATTDAEAEAAWQSMGSSTTAVAASLYGAKKYASAKEGTNVGMKDSVKTVFKDAKSNINKGFEKVVNESPTSLIKKGKAKYNTVKDSIKTMKEEYKDLIPDKKKLSWSELKKSGKDAIKTAYENSGLKETADLSFKEMAAKIVKLGKNAGSSIKNISTEKQTLIAGTYGVTGRTNIKPDFYSQLNAQEQKYYDSLPVSQQETLLKQYYAAA